MMLPQGQKQAVILVDPVSSGRLLKQPVIDAGYDLIGVFTLSPDELKRAGKHLPISEKHALCTHVIYSQDPNAILAEVTQLGFTIRAVIPASEPAVELADLLASRLGLKGHDPLTSHMRRDKLAMRAAVREQGIASPDFSDCSTLLEAKEFISRNGLPVVIKTPKGAGAHHVFICKTMEEVASALESILSDKDIFNQVANTALIEEFIPGQQYVLELFGDGEELHLYALWRLDVGRSLTGQILFDKMIVVTDPLELRSLRPIIEYSKAVGKALGAKWGPCVVELRDHPTKGPLLIEAGIRLAGIDLPETVRRSSNFDPFRATIEAYTEEGRATWEPIRYSHQPCLVFCPIDRGGIVKSIEGVEAIRALPAHLQSNLSISPGDYVSPSGDLATVPLYVYLASNDRNQLAQDIAEVRRLFKVQFQPETGSEKHLNIVR